MTTESKTCNCCASVATALRRVESKLDALLDAMADEAEDEQAASLDEPGEARRPITL